jgi:hypothetical protein
MGITTQQTIMAFYNLLGDGEKDSKFEQEYANNMNVEANNKIQ